MRSHHKRQWLRTMRLATSAASIVVLVPTLVFAQSLFVVLAVPGEATVTLTAEDGTVQTESSSGGAMQITPRRGAGTYQMTLAAGGREERVTIEIPALGQLRVVFNPSASPAVEVFVAAVEEVQVTAQRIQEQLQDVPVAVTALTARDLEVQHITNIQEMVMQAPNLWMEKNTGTSSGSRAAIRGIGEDESFFTSDTPVGIYIDDIYIPRQTGAQFDLYELERLEVLRGPQGTLFGRNTSAGAIRLITKQPGTDWLANVDLSLGQYAQRDVRGSFTSPLSSKISTQAALLYRRHDGYDRDTLNNRRVNDQNLVGLRGSAKIFATPSVNVLVVGDYLRERSTPGFPVAFTPQAPLINGFGVGRIDRALQLDGDSDVRTLQSDLANPINDLDQAGVSASLDWALSDRAFFKSVTGYRRMDNLLLLDADGRVGNFLGLTLPDGRPAPTFHLFQDQAQNQFSQELQVQMSYSPRLRWLGGFYFFHEENAQKTENVIFNDLGRNNFWNTTLFTDSVALYGNATLQASDTLTFTIGARYTRDAKQFNSQVFLPTGAPLIACVGAAGNIVAAARPCAATDPSGSRDTPVQKSLDPSWDGFTPRVAVDFKPADDALLYVSVSRGFKSGAFDGRANTAATLLPIQPINPEHIWAYEGGVKTDWLDNRLRVNVAGFYNDFDDLQGSGTDPAGNFKRFSVGDVVTRGVEVESRVVPVPGLEISGLLAVLRTKYNTVNFNQAVDCGPLGAGTVPLALKYSPRQSGRLGAVYAVPGEVAGGRVTLGSSVHYRASVFHQSCNAGVTTDGPVALADLSAAYDTSDGKWRVSLQVENLTDRVYFTGIFGVAGLRMASAYVAPPRRASVTFRYQYR